MQVTINAGDVRLVAELDNSPTADAVRAALPIRGTANVWGDEIYFSTGLSLTEAPDAREEVPIGTLAYWPPGKAICLFFGPTPVSRGDEPRAASPVNVFGRIDGDAGELRRVSQGARVTITAT